MNEITARDTYLATSLAELRSSVALARAAQCEGRATVYAQEAVRGLF
ncbi:hypothetical protein [Frankia sp. EAN1pec]